MWCVHRTCHLYLFFFFFSLSIARQIRFIIIVETIYRLYAFCSIPFWASATFFACCDVKIRNCNVSLLQMHTFEWSSIFEVLKCLCVTLAHAHPHQTVAPCIWAMATKYYRDYYYCYCCVHRARRWKQRQRLVQKWEGKRINIMGKKNRRKWHWKL